MKKTGYILAIIIVSIVSTVQAQILEKNTLNGTWYTLSVNGNEKTTIQDLQWLSESDDNSDNPYHRIDTIHVVKQLPNQLAILKKPHSNKLALVRNTLVANNTTLHSAILEANESLTALISAAEKYETPAATEIVMTRVHYNKVMKEQIESYPGLDEMKAADLQIALEERAIIGPLLKEYIALHPERASNPYYIYRLAEPFFKRTFIKLGYNPFKAVPYNFEEKFKDNPVIMKLLTEPF